VKYVLKKGAKGTHAESSTEADSAEGKKTEEPKWESKSLAVGNWFSGTRYFRATEDKGASVICRSSGKTIEISKDILENQMHNSSVFAETEKISLTQVASKLAEANSKAFTACFTTKVDDKMVREKLAECDPSQLKDHSFVHELAKDLITGKEHTLVGRLSRAEGKLGRSLVIDLPTQFYRQVDHRTLKWLILDNRKYIVNRS
jgi:beta-xylosidase